MAVTKYYENLKSFSQGRPPLMVFMVCLAAFAVILLTVALYIKSHDVENKDIELSWNTFLQNFADMNFCLQDNFTSPSTTVPPSVTQPTTVSTPAANKTLVSTQLDDIRNYSFALLISLRPTLDLLNIPYNLTHLVGTVTGDDLGIRGPFSQENINITIMLSHAFNGTKCCEPVSIYTCVYFQAPAHVFPSTTGAPDTCQLINDTSSVRDSHVAVMTSRKDRTPYRHTWCRKKPKIEVQYKMDNKLNIMLSIGDRSIINLHLMHTSYFLFVMVITLFCYAVIKGRPSKPKLQVVQQV